MASINFNPFENWFSKPPNPVPLINLHSISQSLLLPKSSTIKFASISSSLFGKGKQPEKEKEKTEEEESGHYTKILDQFFWECENLPDYRHTPEVEKILKENPVFETKDNPTPEEIKENEQWWKDFRFYNYNCCFCFVVICLFDDNCLIERQMLYYLNLIYSRVIILSWFL